MLKAWLIERQGWWLKSYTQQERLDCQETFSPVVKMETVRDVLSIAAMKTWKLHQMDIFNAFLQEDLVEDVYMSPPPGLFTKREHSLVCKLKKSLYGLKQASRKWNLKLCEALISSNFVQSHHDYSLFVKKSGNNLVLILVYVGDLVITSSFFLLLKKLSICFNSISRSRT